MGVNEVTGKAVLHSMVNGSASPEEYNDQPGAQKLRDLSRFLRWLACSLMPKEFEAIINDKQNSKGWADATMSATLYFAIEDYILSSLLKAVQTKETNHLSLHFDGVRVDKTRVELEGGDGEHFCRFLEKPSWRTVAMRCNWQSRSISRACSWSPRLALTPRSCSSPQTTCFSRSAIASLVPSEQS